MINTKVDGGVAVIEFNRSKANAYNAEFMRSFNQAIDHIEAQKSITVVCLKSRVPGFFCAGADIKEFASNTTSDNLVLVALANKATAKMQASNKVYVSAVKGHALGGGLEIMLATDIRLGADANYKLGMSEVALGLMPGNGGTQRFARIVGLAKALEYCVSGAQFDPQEGLGMGVFNHLYALDDFDQVVDDYCLKVSRGAPLAIAAIKRAMYQGAAMPLDEALQLESSLANDLYETDDANEGLASFLEKRPAVFGGR